MECVETKLKAITLVDYAVNHARRSFEEQCTMIHTNHFSVSMARLAALIKKIEDPANFVELRDVFQLEWRKVYPLK